LATLAGSPGNWGTADGKGTAAQLNYPGRLAIDAAGNLYVSDNDGQSIRRIIIASGDVASQPAFTNRFDQLVDRYLLTSHGHLLTAL
jgi:DNA-binding beta-propeller fold protein YncE